MFRNAACSRRQHVYRAPTRGEEQERGIENRRTDRERLDWPNCTSSRCDVSIQPNVRTDRSGWSLWMGIENARKMRAQMAAVVDGLMRAQIVRGATESSETDRQRAVERVRCVVFE